jgi:hypothetical protein
MMLSPTVRAQPFAPQTFTLIASLPSPNGCGRWCVVVVGTAQSSQESAGK